MRHNPCLTGDHDSPDVSILEDRDDRCGLRFEGVLHDDQSTKLKVTLHHIPAHSSIYSGTSHTVPYGPRISGILPH